MMGDAYLTIHGRMCASSLFRLLHDSTTTSSLSVCLLIKHQGKKVAAVNVVFRKETMGKTHKVSIGD
jgi:hypothetical protein